MVEVLKATVRDFREDKALRLAAAMSYYALLSLAPLLIVAVAVAGMVWGRQSASAEVVEQMENQVGAAGAEVAQSVLASAAQPARGIVALAIGGGVLLLGATGLFLQLQGALNTIWDVRPRPGQGVRGFIRKRVLSLAMVLGVGLLLLVLLAASTAISAAHEYLAGLVPGMEWIWRAGNELLSFALMTLLFALVFKYVPDVRIRWRDVWTGAAVTAVLFLAGRFLLGWYLGRGSVGSAYGAAGSLVAMLVWVYYSSVLLFLGAEFTQAQARARGAPIVPAQYAVAAPA